MLTYEHIPENICPSLIKVWIDENTDTFISVAFLGGCHGWIVPLVKLLKGQSIDRAIEVLGGVKCGRRGTSCPDQLAQALKNYKAERQNNDTKGI